MTGITITNGGSGYFTAQPLLMRFSGKQVSPLQAAGSAATAPFHTEPLTLAQVQPLLTEAIVRWDVIGANVTAVDNIEVRIRDLGANTLGLASYPTIWLDDDAAGRGWFVDATPGDDREFTLPGSQGEQNRMDLLTVVMHELGHLLGHDHDSDGVMAETLAAGVRRTGLEHDEVARVDQVMGQAGDQPKFAGLGAWLSHQVDSLHGRAKRRR